MTGRAFFVPRQDFSESKLSSNSAISGGAGCSGHHLLRKERDRE
jgi:hypothetical protein